MSGDDGDDDQDFGAGGGWKRSADGGGEKAPGEDRPRSIEDNPYVDRLLRDPRLREAMKNGELGRFRGLLDYYRSRADEPDQVAAVDYVSANPQLLAPLVDKPPKVFSVGGFGTRLYGTKDFDKSTGFYVTTLYLALLFIPVFPIRRYLVRTGEGKHEFYGKFGASAAQNIWRVMLVLGVLGIGALGALIIAIASMTHEPDVQIINAFDEPVEVIVDGEESYEIAPRTLQTEAIPEGTRQFSTRFVDGPEIEELDFEVPRRTDVVVYNVAGAAPAIVESVTYFNMESTEYRTGAYRDHEEDYELLAGIRRYVRDDVHYIDVEPPDEIDTFVGGETVRWALYYEELAEDWTLEEPAEIYDGAPEVDDLGLDDADWVGDDLDGGESDDFLEYYLTPESALDQLSYEDTSRMEELLERLIELRPRATWHHFWIRQQLNDAVEMAEWTNDADDWEEVDRWFDRLNEVGREHPDAVELHLLLMEFKRFYHDRLQRTSAAEWYRQHHEEFNTAATAYLLTHVTDDLDEMESLLERILDEEASPALTSSAHRSFGSIYHGKGDCGSAIDHYEVSLGIDDGLIHQNFGPYVECLTDAGQFRSARDFLRDTYRALIASGEYFPFDPASYYGRVVLSDDGTDDDPLSLIEDYYRAQDQDYMRLDGDEYVRYANAMGMAIDEERAQALGMTEFGRDERRVNQFLYQRPEELMDALRFDRESFLASGPDVGLLAAMLLAAGGDTSGYDTFEFYYDDWGGMDDVRREIEHVSDNYRFDASPPKRWRPAERAVYYLARAYVTDDDDERERALEKVHEETFLWGPLDGIAAALSDE